MGAFLEKPAVEKENASGSGTRLTYAMSSMQGWRSQMEDAHIATTELSLLPQHAFFAVFDGHGGKTVSDQCAEHFLDVMFNSTVFQSGDKSPSHLKNTLREAHLAMDRYLLDNFPRLVSLEDRSGTTAACAFVTPTHIIISNCGDSRAVLYSNEAVRFGSEDHKPSNLKETERIQKADGQVALGRVNGVLAVSRALGDFAFKEIKTLRPEEQKVSAEPDMTVLDRNDNDEFLVLACDGIWDVMSNEAVYEFISNQLKAGYTSTDICNRLLDYCLSLSSKDNMSVVVVIFPSAPQKIEGFQAPEVIPDPVEAAQNESPAPQGAALGINNILSALISGQQDGNVDDDEDKDDDNADQDVSGAEEQAPSGSQDTSS